MIIHMHQCAKAHQATPITEPPVFYPYDSIQAEGSTSIAIPPTWTTQVEGLQLGFTWTTQHQTKLLNYPIMKTYEILTGDVHYRWVGVERVGYLLPGGFLPIWVTYRKADQKKRYVMPRNVGQLYNYLADATYYTCAGISPSLQFVLDLSVEMPKHIVQNHNYLLAQLTLHQELDHIPQLTQDIRSRFHAADSIRYVSQMLDTLGNQQNLDIEDIRTWYQTQLLVKPPVLDWVLSAYPHGCIPIAVLHGNYTQGVIDPTLPTTLGVEQHQYPIPETVYDAIFALCSTDLHVGFSLYGGSLDYKQLWYHAQNRFAAYLPQFVEFDLKQAASIVELLWMQYVAAFACTPLTLPQLAVFQLTANDEVKITFGDSADTQHQCVYYADLSTVLNLRYSVAQTPVISQRR